MWRPPVGHVQEVFGGVDDVGRDPEQFRHDVVRAAGQARERRVRSGQAVGRLVHGAVPAERHHHVVVLGGGVATQFDRVALGLGVDRRDVVAALQRIQDEALEPVGHLRRDRVDDHEHPLRTLGAR